MTGVQVNSGSLVVAGFPGVVESSAVLAGEDHRYLLTRTWDVGRPAACFTLLNPARADHAVNDQTILRCMRWALRWGFGGIVVANAFSFRTAKPDELLAQDFGTAVGDENNEYIIRAVRSTNFTVVGWGNHARWNDRDLEVLDLVRAHARPYCLGVTLSGMPLHPMARGKHRVPDDVVPAYYGGRPAVGVGGDSDGEAAEQRRGDRVEPGFEARGVTAEPRLAVVAGD